MEIFYCGMPPVLLCVRAVYAGGLYLVNCSIWNPALSGVVMGVAAPAVSGGLEVAGAGVWLDV